ncbi:MAG: PIG-L family deacetylase [Myxococcota bacterium]
MTRVYVSPHLDDAVFSCAAGIVACRAAGRRVVVITVFGADQPQRRAEDRAALASVGAECMHLDFADAPVRRGLVPSFHSLVVQPRLQSTEVERIAHALRRYLAVIEPRESWWPLGIGGHLDHRTLFAASRLIERPASYYDDRPYAFVPAWAELRRLELEGGRMSTPPRPTELGAQVDAGGVAAMFGADERAQALEALASRCAAEHPGQGLQLRSTLHRHPDHGVAALQLLSRYRSQLAWISGGGSEPWPWIEHAGLGGAVPTERETTLSAR